jgi:hypothetical protein
VVANLVQVNGVCAPSQRGVTCDASLACDLQVRVHEDALIPVRKELSSLQEVAVDDHHGIYGRNGRLFMDCLVRLQVDDPRPITKCPTRHWRDEDQVCECSEVVRMVVGAAG